MYIAITFSIISNSNLNLLYIINLVHSESQNEEILQELKIGSNVIGLFHIVLNSYSLALVIPHRFLSMVIKCIQHKYNFIRKECFVSQYFTYCYTVILYFAIEITAKT